MSHEMQALTGMIRGLMAGVLLIMFLGLWMWVFRTRHRQSFEMASRLPLEEDPTGDSTA